MFDWKTLQPVGIAVQATPIVKVIYTTQLKFCGYTVKANQDVLVWFDKDKQRMGEWVANGTGCYNIYNVNNQVVGLTT